MTALKFRGTIQKFPEFALHYVEVSPASVKKLGGKFRLRLNCTLQKKHKFPIGLGSLGDGGKGYITVSKKRLAELGLELGDTVAVELELDKSKYGYPVPAEVKELLRQDAPAARRFETLSAGKKRSVLHHVGGAKNSDLRLERALRVLENLKALPEGSETLRAIFGRGTGAGASAGRSGRW